GGGGPPTHSTEGGIDERHHRVEVGPDTGPNIKMMAYSPAPVAAALSNSSRLTLPGENCCAAMPDPMTTAARKALPSSSAASRRQRASSITTPPIGRREDSDRSAARVADRLVGRPPCGDRLAVHRGAAFG